jgi:hypothetical protein
MLGNWLHRRGEEWEDRVQSWLPVAGFDTLVVQREVQDPAEYVALWLRDSGDVGGAHGEGGADYVHRYDEWLAALEAADVEAIGFGFVSVRRTDGPATTDLLDWPYPVEQPLGPHIDAAFERRRWARDRGTDEALLAAHLRLADGVLQEQIGQPGAEDPERIVLRQQRGFRRVVDCDTAVAALAGACDGSVAVGTLVDAVAAILGEDSASARVRLLPQVRDLVETGFLETS